MGMKFYACNYIITISTPLNLSGPRWTGIVTTAAISWIRYGMEAVTNTWEESLQQVCFLYSLATRKKFMVPH